MNLITKDDCIDFNYEMDYSGMLMVLDVKNTVKEKYQTPQYQIVHCSGFGCNPSASTNSTFVMWPDGDRVKYSRNEIIGCPKREVLKQWFNEYGNTIMSSSFLEAIKAELKLTDEDIITEQKQLKEKRETMYE